MQKYILFILFFNGCVSSNYSARNPASPSNKNAQWRIEENVLVGKDCETLLAIAENAKSFFKSKTLVSCKTVEGIKKVSLLGLIPAQMKKINESPQFGPQPNCWNCVMFLHQKEKRLRLNDEAEFKKWVESDVCKAVDSLRTGSVLRIQQIISEEIRIKYKLSSNKIDVHSALSIGKGLCFERTGPEKWDKYQFTKCENIQNIDYPKNSEENPEEKFEASYYSCQENKAKIPKAEVLLEKTSKEPTKKH